jgi:hypothetical protein
MARKPNATSGNCSLIGPLSPAGVIATSVVSSSQGGCGGGPGIFLVGPSGGIGTRPVTSNAYADGWIDPTHWSGGANPGVGLFRRRLARRTLITRP